MLDKLRNVFQVPELKRRILFTLALFVIYRLGEHMPTPGVNAVAGDCHVHLCIAGKDTDTVDDTDLPVTTNDCITPNCTMGVPTLPNKSAGERICA